jgi:hypothetical protein
VSVRRENSVTSRSTGVHAQLPCMNSITPGIWKINSPGTDEQNKGKMGYDGKN